MTIEIRKRKRPDIAAFAKRTIEKYPNVLAHLAEMERLENVERTDKTDGDETPESSKS